MKPHWVIGPMTRPWYKTNDQAKFARWRMKLPWYKLITGTTPYWGGSRDQNIVTINIIIIRRCVTLINITDCAAKSVLFAVAFHARKCFGAATPSELYDCIKHRGHITMILNLLIEKVAYSRHGPTSA